jgi:hypothetical protein
MPLEGDGELVIRSVHSGEEWRQPIGALPPSPTASADHNPERPAPRREPSVAFSPDGRFILATRFPSDADRKAARRERKALADGLLIVNPANRSVEHIDRVRGYQVAGRSQTWLAVLVASSDPSAKGAELQLRPLGDASPTAIRRFAGVTEYALQREGRALVFATAAEGNRPAGVFHVVPGTDAPPQPILTGAREYRRLTWDRQQQRLAFFAHSSGSSDAAEPSGVFLWETATAQARPLLAAAAPGTPLAAGLAASPDHAPVFSFDG